MDNACQSDGRQLFLVPILQLPPHLHSALTVKLTLQHFPDFHLNHHLSFCVLTATSTSFSASTSDTTSQLTLTCSSSAIAALQRHFKSSKTQYIKTLTLKCFNSKFSALVTQIVSSPEYSQRKHSCSTTVAVGSSSVSGNYNSCSEMSKLLNCL